MSTQRRFYNIGCGMVGVLVVLAVLFGVAAYQFKKYQAILVDLPDKVTPILIAITDPYTGQTVPAGAPLLVHVDAGSPDALLSLELWANGQIVGVQAAPEPNGITPFSADFAWTPTDPGTYTLIARGLQAGDQSADSTGVVVIVGPTEKTQPATGAGDDGQSIPIANGGGGDGSSVPLPSPPSPPSPSASIGPAQIWNLSIGDWLSSFSSSAPKAPELTAAPEGCGATLSIHDLSDGEDGFFVFRMTKSAPDLDKIATLDGQSQLDWLTYTDQSYTNENSYMVRAFKGAKVADSNIVFVKGDPAGCKSDAPQLPQLSIQLTSLTTDLPADQIYCYESLGGLQWSRWPVSGFFTPGANGFDIQAQGESLLLDNLGDSALSLDLECWAWVGGSLQLLGKFHEDNVADPGSLGTVRLQNDHLQLGVDLSRGGLHTLDWQKAPTDPLMPNIYAIKFTGADACKPHTPSKGASGLENFLYCTPYTEYTIDTQPYLVWYVSDVKCQAAANCRPLSWYVQQAKTYGGKVGYHVYGAVSNVIPLATTKADATVWILPPLSKCGQDEYLHVRIFFQGGPNDPLYPNQTIESPDSNTVYYTYICPLPSKVNLDVTFDKLHIGNADDGPADDTLEIYGSLAGEGIPGSGSVLNIGKWGWSVSDCELAGYSPECPTPVTNGDRPFAGQPYLIGGGIPMCPSDSYKHCNGPYDSFNPVIHVTVADNSKLRVSVHIMDYDGWSGDDDVCHVEMSLGLKSIGDWQGFSVNTSMSQGDNGYASCIVYFHVAPSP